MKVKSFVIVLEKTGDFFRKEFKALDYMTELLGDVTIHSVRDSFYKIGNDRKIVRVVIYSEK